VEFASKKLRVHDIEPSNLRELILEYEESMEDSKEFKVLE